MRDYIDSLIAGNLGEAPALRPRIPSRFEPIRTAARNTQSELPESETSLSDVADSGAALDTVGLPTRLGEIVPAASAGNSPPEGVPVPPLPPAGITSDSAAQRNGDSRGSESHHQVAAYPDVHSSRREALSIQLPDVPTWWRAQLDRFTREMNIIRTLTSAEPADSHQSDSSTKSQDAPPKSPDVHQRRQEHVADESSRFEIVPSSDGADTTASLPAPPAFSESPRLDVVPPDVPVIHGIASAKPFASSSGGLQIFPESVAARPSGNTRVDPTINATIDRLLDVRPREVPVVQGTASVVPFVSPSGGPQIFPESVAARPSGNMPVDPTINVTIGRVDVRAIRPDPPAAAMRKERSVRPAMTLDDYLSRRSRGGAQ
jgi:hypothetical protein